VTLRDVVAGLDQFADDETIYAESASPAARAVIAAEPEMVRCRRLPWA